MVIQSIRSFVVVGVLLTPALAQIGSAKQGSNPSRTDRNPPGSQVEKPDLPQTDFVVVKGQGPQHEDRCTALLADAKLLHVYTVECHEEPLATGQKVRGYIKGGKLLIQIGGKTTIYGILKSQLVDSAAADLEVLGLADKTLNEDLSAPRPPQSAETLIFGNTILRLGMSKDIIVPALALQYDVALVFPGCKLDLPECRRYSIMTGKSGVIGTLDFNAQGNLVAATKHWTPEFRHYGDGEIGRIVSALMGGLAIEGKRVC